MIHPMTPKKTTTKDLNDTISANFYKANLTNSQEASFAEGLGIHMMIVDCGLIKSRCRGPNCMWHAAMTRFDMSNLKCSSVLV
jgi:hypothetical protein